MSNSSVNTHKMTRHRKPYFPKTLRAPKVFQGFRGHTEPQKCQKRKTKAGADELNFPFFFLYILSHKMLHSQNP